MTQFDALKDVIGSISLTDQRDTYKWSLNATGGYSVASARTFVDDTIVNLNRKGVQIDSTLCQTCQLDVETVNHIFFNCELAKDLWSLLAKWWDLDILIFANISEWYDCLGVVRVVAMKS
nr:hypothetical protein [Tanacetum cinerariifolium]